MNGQASPSRHASSIPSYITKTSLVLACSSVLVLVALIGLLMHDDALDLLATSKDHPAWEHEECRKHRLSTHIPKILHQSYKTKRLPADFAMWQTSWLQLHPHWCYMFWTDRDNRHVVLFKRSICSVLPMHLFPSSLLYIHIEYTIIIPPTTHPETL